MLLSLIAKVVSSANMIKLDRSDKDRKSIIYTRNVFRVCALGNTSCYVFYVELTTFKKTYFFLSYK